MYPGGYWTPPRVLHKADVEARASDVQDQPQLKKEMGASLGYTNRLKKKRKQNKLKASILNVGPCLRFWR